MKIVNLKPSSSSKLIAKLINSGMIESVTGYGKGRYKFIRGNKLN